MPATAASRNKRDKLLHFDEAETSGNLTLIEGEDAFLQCVVRNVGNKSVRNLQRGIKTASLFVFLLVSQFSIKTFPHSIRRKNLKKQEILYGKRKLQVFSLSTFFPNTTTTTTTLIRNIKKCIIFDQVLLEFRDFIHWHSWTIKQA